MRCLIPQQRLRFGVLISLHRVPVDPDPRFPLQISQLWNTRLLAGAGGWWRSRKVPPVPPSSRSVPPHRYKTWTQNMDTTTWIRNQGYVNVDTKPGHKTWMQNVDANRIMRTKLLGSAAEVIVLPSSVSCLYSIALFAFVCLKLVCPA